MCLLLCWLNITLILIWSLSFVHFLIPSVYIYYVLSLWLADTVYLGPNILGPSVYVGKACLRHVATLYVICEIVITVREFVITLCEFDITLCEFVITLRMFVITLYEFVITLCKFFIMLCEYDISLCEFVNTLFDFVILSCHKS